ncbi:MAG: 4-hydroxy-tetrahydrodipicolinate reductase [Ignavibacteriales bacterium]|nr:4-hydroxy-tetrahydrodipicolinate reductase [Ignavibacteriales bacterium]
MRIALIGYGKMGKEIEQQALEKDVQVTARFDSKNSDISKATHDFDVAVHFAAPGPVVRHVEACARAKKNMVIGTTGWTKDMGKVWSIVQDQDIGLVHATNFSVGVNIFFQMIKHSAKSFDRFVEYDVFVQETHHKDKADSPSGTALTIAEILMQRIKRKKELLNTPPTGRIKPEQLHVSSTRAGSVIGAHSVIFDSSADSIELTHNAKNRSGFALGALLAAEWVHGKQGIFTMEDVLSDVIP